MWTDDDAFDVFDADVESLLRVLVVGDICLDLEPIGAGREAQCAAINLYSEMLAAQRLLN